MLIHISKRLMTRVIPVVLLMLLVILRPVAAQEQDDWSFETTPSFKVAEAETEEEGEEPQGYDYVLNKLSVLWELANTYVEAKRYDEAIETYQKIIDFKIPEDVPEALRNDMEFDRVHIYMTIADLYMDLKNDFDTAMQYMEKGLAHMESLQQDIPAAKVMTVEMYKMLGGAYRSKGNYDKAIEYLNKALEVE